MSKFTNLISSILHLRPQVIKNAETTAGFWLKNNAQRLKKAKAVVQPIGRNLVIRGELYLYVYDPKTKAKLPFYDTFPLVMVFGERGKNQIYGLNFHYLNYANRAKLFDLILNSNQQAFQGGKVNISWQQIKKFRQDRLVYPCVKLYDKSHIRSEIIKVPREEWATALFLPIAMFKKKPQEGVWASYDTRGKIRKVRKRGNRK